MGIVLKQDWWAGESALGEVPRMVKAISFKAHLGGPGENISFSVSCQPGCQQSGPLQFKFGKAEKM